MIIFCHVVDNFARLIYKRKQYLTLIMITCHLLSMCILLVHIVKIDFPNLLQVYLKYFEWNLYLIKQIELLY